MNLQNQTILIISNEAWGPTWYSKHNYANELSKKNTVYFIDPPKKWKIINIFRNNVSAKTIKKNLYLLSYANILPASGTCKLFFKINEKINFRKLKRYFLRKGLENIIFWSFDPYRLLKPSRLECNISIFHYADRYTNYGLKIILQDVDVILSISSYFYQYVEKFNKPFFVTNHGISSQNFYADEDAFATTEIKDYILYVGSVDYRIDYELLFKLIQKYYSYMFVFVGNYEDALNNPFGKRIFFDEEFSNVFKVGIVEFVQLKNYISEALVCIAPMDVSMPGNRINHQKLLQYLAMGKPILCPVFIDFALEKDIFYFYNNTAECFDAFSLALAEGDDMALKQKRIELAQKFTFEKQIERIEFFLNSTFNG